MARTVHLTDEVLRDELRHFEEAHGMSSADFYEKFTSGMAGDSPDIVEWAWLYEVAVQAGALTAVAHA